MARANHVKKAQKDIYVLGKFVTYVSQKGKREGQTLTKLDRTIPKDETDQILIHKGEPYYWWQFQNGPMHISKERPKASQLTQSEHLSTIYEFAERISEFTAETSDEVSEFVEQLKSDTEELRDTTQEKLDNMPEGLQQGPTGELLQERIDSLESAISDLEGIDCDYEEMSDDDAKEKAAEENSIDTDVEGWEDLVNEEDVDNVKAEHMREWIDEKLGELQDISFY